MTNRLSQNAKDSYNIQVSYLINMSFMMIDVDIFNSRTVSGHIFLLFMNDCLFKVESENPVGEPYKVRLGFTEDTKPEQRWSVEKVSRCINQFFFSVFIYS